MWNDCQRRGEAGATAEHEDISAQLLSTLEVLRRERFGRVVDLDPERQAERSAAEAEEWVFLDSDGGRLDPDNFRRRVFVPLLTAAKLRQVRIHDLRHTYASLLIEARKELHYIQEQLGHHSPAFTLAIYGHLLPRDRRGEVDCLDDSAPSGTLSAPETPKAATA